MSGVSLHHETETAPGPVEVLLAVLLTLLLMLGLARPAGGGHSLPVSISSSAS